MFIETIRINHGRITHQTEHLKRMQQTQLEYYGDSLIQHLAINIPAIFQQGLVKCHITYDRIVSNIKFDYYQPKTIHRLKLVEDKMLDYHMKYADRSKINQLKARHSEYSDIIITQQGYLTDTSYSNIVLFDGENYITPDTYLLNGIQRQYLLNQGIISERTVHTRDLRYYQDLYLINAMLTWEDKISIPIRSIDC